MDWLLIAPVHVFSITCTIFVAKTKALISCAVTAQLICGFVFAYAKRRFSYVAAQLCFIFPDN